MWIGTYKQWQDLFVWRDGFDTFLVNKDVYRTHRSFRVALIISDGLAPVTLTMPINLLEHLPFSTAVWRNPTPCGSSPAASGVFSRVRGAREASRPCMEVVPGV